MDKSYGNNKEYEVLHDIYNKNKDGVMKFIKIKQTLDIDKMAFAFVLKEGDKIDSIDIYMEAEEFGALLMKDIEKGILLKKLYDEKAKGAKYPAAVWTSNYGGYENAGKCYSRYFTISPGSNVEVLFTAYLYPAQKTSTGAYIPVKDADALITIRVGCSYNDLKIIQYKWSFLESDYMSSKYNMEAMRSEYSRSKENSDTSSAKKTSSSKSSANKQASTTSSNSTPKAAATTTAPAEEKRPPIPSYDGHDDNEPSENTNVTAKAEETVSMFQLKSTCELLPMKNNIDQCIKATDREGNEKYVVFLKDITKNVAKWREFEDVTMKRASGVAFTIYAITRPTGTLEFRNFVA